MSHIVSFSITGLAGRKNIYEQNLNRDDNIFFGVNGSGKTSLLKILHSAMQNDARILRLVPFTSATVKIYSVTYKKIFTRTIHKSKEKEAPQKRVALRTRARRGVIEGYEIVGPLEDTHLTWKCTTKAKKDVKSTSWSHRYLPTSRLHMSEEPEWLYGPGEIHPLTEENLDLLFEKSVERLWTRYSAEVLTEVRSAQEKGLTGILKAVLSTTRKKKKSKARKLSAETAYERVEKFLSRQKSASILGTFSAFEKRYKQDENLQSVVADIDQVEERIEEAVKSRDRLKNLIKKMYKGNKNLKFEDQSIQIEKLDGGSIGLTTLSSGEKHLLRIFLETLLVGESSIIIDEPEISMHVDWQRELIAAMHSLNPSAQLIVATHSPEIIADISDDKIFEI